MRNTSIYKDIVVCFYLSTVTLVWSSRGIGQRVRSHEEAVGSQNCQQDLTYNSHATTHNIFPLLVTAHTHATLVFHWLLSTSMRCLPFIGYALYLCNACFRKRFVDFTYGRIYRSTTSARFIAGQGDILHSPGALQNSKYYFIAITPWFTLIRSSYTC